MILGVSLYVLGFAFGPLVWGPISEVYGRTRPLFIGMAVFIILQISLGVALNLETVFICRFLGGIAGSSPLAVVAGMYVDLMEAIERGMATAAYEGATFAGPAAGPVVGPFITKPSRLALDGVDHNDYGYFFHPSWMDHHSRNV
jgi:MFS transporter, DHA1 family, multidrug resistance protein